ncbi:hypothetical protein DFP73DRAFT_563314 [Morchella snyderi]|nr:hypothetical protein DFP73DRAFT_563314 [Morchella snyderi]
MYLAVWPVIAHMHIWVAAWFLTYRCHKVVAEIFPFDHNTGLEHGYSNLNAWRMVAPLTRVFESVLSLNSR